MWKKQKIIIFMGLALISLLIHFHYIDYGVALDGHILPLVPSRGEDAARIREQLKKTIRRTNWIDFSEMSSDQIERQWASKTSPIPISHAEAANAAAAAFGSPAAAAETAFADAQRDAKQIKRRALASTWLKNLVRRAETERELAIVSVDYKPVYFGMLVSSDLGKNASQARREAFWGGVIAPLILLLGLLLWMVRVKAKPKPALGDVTSPNLSPEEPALVPNRVETRDQSESTVSLADLLFEQLGADFPVMSGNGTQSDPLIITADTDYVSVEYVVVRHVLRAHDEEYKLSEQSIKTTNNKMVDELVFKVKPAGSVDWTGVRRFYFDITIGFSRLGS